MNDLIVLGGSSAGVGTGQGCSSYLVRDDHTTIVLDMGPDTLQELRKHTDFRKLDAIFISHLHMDHVLDLFALRFMLSYNPVKPERTIPLYLPPTGIKFMAKAAALFATDADDIAGYFSAVFDMREYDPDGTCQIDAFTVSFTPTVHLIPCWAMRISTISDQTLVYTADTGTDADLDSFARGADLLIADSAAPPDAPEHLKRGVHFDAAAAAALAQRSHCRRLVLSHQWEELDPTRNAEIARRIFTGPIAIATPGLKVEW